MATAQLEVTSRAIPLASQSPARRQGGLWSDAARRLRRDRVTVVALGVLLVFVALAACADLLADGFFGYSFTRQDLLNSYARPDLAHPSVWLGSDNLGRSQVVRLLYGARISLAVGFCAGVIK